MSKTPNDVKEIKDVEALKRNWCEDPCWDIERTEGFEEHYAELLAYRLQFEYEHIKVDDIELAKMFVERANLHKQLAEVDAKITRQVLGRKGTTKIAGVTASYFKPSDDVDYETSARWAGVDPAIIEECTYTPPATPYVSWKEVCEKAGIEPFVRETKPARVVIK